MAWRRINQQPFIIAIIIICMNYPLKGIREDSLYIKAEFDLWFNSRVVLAEATNYDISCFFL